MFALHSLFGNRYSPVARLRMENLNESFDPRPLWSNTCRRQHSLRASEAGRPLLRSDTNLPTRSAELRVLSSGAV